MGWTGYWPCGYWPPWGWAFLRFLMTTNAPIPPMTMTARTSRRSQLEAEEEEEAAASPFVLPFTLTLILTLDQVTVPVDLSIVPPLSAELGTKPPANFAVTFPTLSNLSLGNSLDRDFNTPSDSEVKVKLFPETSKNSLISVSLTSVITSQTFTEPSVWNLVLRSELVLEM